MATTNRDIFTVLPLEIAQRCIAEACEGNQYMANLLTFTMVSRNWCRILMEIPTLWAIIHVNDMDEDSMAATALFLHLSREVQLSLRIWVPLSNGWDIISPMFLPRRDRIRKITLQPDSETHSAECRFKTDVSNATILYNLLQVFESLDFPTSIEYLDVILDRPVRMDSTWVPPNLTSSGNWLIPLRVLESCSHSFPKLRYLSMNATDLATLLPHLSVLGQLQQLYLHSEEQDYIDAPPPPSATNVVASLRIPFLNTLQYHGRLYWASVQLLSAAAQTIRNLDLQIGVLDLNLAMNALAASKSLRRFSLTLLRLEYDLDGSNKRRLYLPMNIENQTSRVGTPKWRLKQLEDFRCKMKSFRISRVSGNVDLDHLWRLFHTVFPKFRILVWQLPIQSDSLLISLIRQKQLRHFESNMVPVPPSRQLTGFVLPSLESLRIKDVQMFHGMVIPNLQHLSAPCQEDFTRPAGFTFTQLRSLDLKISEHVENIYEMSSGELPLLKVLSLTFLGSRGGFPLLQLPSLTEITISTRLPTFTQGMRFCVSLMYEPWKCPRLEQINLDSFLEWDLLYLLLRARNFFQHVSVSRIKTMRVPLLPPKFRPMFVQLLAGRHISSLPFFWSLMKQISIEGAQSRLLDQHIMGCFSCVYWGLGDCCEPLQASRLPQEYHGEDRVLSDKIEPLGLFPVYSWDMTRLVIPVLSMYENIWIVAHRERAERWRNQAFAWSKLHQRTLTCHKWCCNSKTVVTEHDMEGDESRPILPSPAFFRLEEHGEFCHAIRATIPSLLELLQDQDREIRSTAASTLTELGVHSELLEAIRIIPSLMELLQNQDCDVRSSTASTLEKLVEHAELRPAIEAVIPSLIELLEDSSFNVRSTAASALVTLVGRSGFCNVIHAAITPFVALLRDHKFDVRSTATPVFAPLAEHTEFRNAIKPAISSLVGQLKDRYSYVRSTAASALITLAGHAEFCNAIHAAITPFAALLRDYNSDARSTGLSTLATLAEHAEFCNAIHATMMPFVVLLRDHRSDVRSNASSGLATLEEYDGDFEVRSTTASALAKLAEHAEFCNAIHAVMMPFVLLLSDHNFDVRSTAVSALITLAEYPKLRIAIHAAIPSLVELLKNRYSDVRSAAASALTKLAEHGELPPNIFMTDSSRPVTGP